MDVLAKHEPQIRNLNIDLWYAKESKNKCFMLEKIRTQEYSMGSDTLNNIEIIIYSI